MTDIMRTLCWQFCGDLVFSQLTTNPQTLQTIVHKGLVTQAAEIDLLTAEEEV